MRPELYVKGFSADDKDLRTARSVNKGHGRHEERTLTTSKLLDDYLNWPGLAQPNRLERRSVNITTGEVRHETVYGITSLTAQRRMPSASTA